MEILRTTISSTKHTQIHFEIHFFQKSIFFNNWTFKQVSADFYSTIKIRLIIIILSPSFWFAPRMSREKEQTVAVPIATTQIQIAEKAKLVLAPPLTSESPAANVNVCFPLGESESPKLLIHSCAPPPPAAAS